MSDEKDKSSCANCGKAPKGRSDFPIDWEGDHYVSRREMVKFLTLGSAVLTTATWVTTAAGKFVQHGAKGERYIGSAEILEKEGSLLFRYPTDQEPCIAVKTPEGELVAYSQVCTHLSCAVIYSKSDNELICPCHNGHFSVAEGAPVSGPPTRPLPRVKLEQRGDQIFAVEREA